MHDCSASNEENAEADRDEDDAANVGHLAALENGAAVEQLDDDDVKSNDSTTESRDVVLEERVGLNKRGVVVDPVQNGLPSFLRHVGGSAKETANVRCHF